MDWQTVFIVVGGGALALAFGWCGWLTTRTGAVEKELADYKLQVAEKFASVEHLKEVEERLIKVIADLGAKFDRFAETFQKHLINGARSFGRRRSDPDDFDERG